MKILITGSNGMLGTDLVNLLKSREASLEHNPEVIEAPHEVLDITLEDRVSDYIFTHTPDIIVNCAAFTNVDKCETEREAAFSVNALGPKYLASAAKKCGARVIQISTDFVFDGNGNRPYTEEDQTNPLSEYGRTKLEGERSIQNHCDSYLIVRTSWLLDTTESTSLQKCSNWQNSIKSCPLLPMKPDLRHILLTLLKRCGY
jgi:dTDP-4-dehydrorhamnose reductase